MPSGYSATLPNDILLDQGLFYVGATLVGATSDALKFDPKRSLRNIPFAGKRSPIAGLDRVTEYIPTISGTLLQFGVAQIGYLLPASASVTVGGVTTWTPVKAGVLITRAQCLVNARAIWPRGGGGWAQVRLPLALVETWSLDGNDPGEATIPISVVARLDMTVGGATTDDPPYVIEHLTAGP